MTGQVHRNEHSSTLSDNMFSTLEFGVAGFTFVAFVRIIIRLYDHGLLRQRVNVRTTTTKAVVQQCYGDLLEPQSCFGDTPVNL